jgi:hypothetical protein
VICSFLQGTVGSIVDNVVVSTGTVILAAGKVIASGGIVSDVFISAGHCWLYCG